MKIYYYLTTLVLSLLLIFSVGCKVDEEGTPDPGSDTFGTGLTDDDDMSQVPSSTNFGFGSDNLPTSYDLLDKFPPTGNQGQYGTCVGWAVGYNAKTVINGIEKGYTASDLASANKQFSAKDLFLAIDDDKKNPNCTGTGFENALQVVQDRGVATLQTVPYTNLGDCSQANLDPAWAQEAANNKIKYWRKIDGSISAIRKNISQNVPVIFGAKLADNFMTHKSDEIISSNTTYDQIGLHAYHAMIIAGYDDNKGPNGAFRIVNSWGNDWGASGKAWIDYNFFFNEFVMGSGDDRTLFIAANDGGDNPPDPNPTSGGVDLVPWVFGDESTDNWNYPTERKMYFNIYNIGDEHAMPTADWSFYSIYYNAFNANDYGVIFYDEFNTSIPENTIECPTDWNCIINLPIPAGGDFASYAFGDEYVQQYYYMPQITGFYYLLTLADAEDKFQEQDEMNNLFYTSYDPLYFENGVAWLSPNKSSQKFKLENTLEISKKNLRKSEYNTVVRPEFKNAYSPEEIRAFFKKEKENGNIDKKINEYLNKTKAHGYPKMD